MVSAKPKIGLLLLYLKLYDEVTPERRREFAPFIEAVEDGFQAEGVEVLASPVCRLRSEFQEAVDSWEKEDVDLIVTLHLAYSPSLESADALSTTELPILMLDTTMDHDFGRDVDPSRIMYNHGIHGVQDLASVLNRRRKHFEIVAGHVSQSNVIRRAADIARAARAARVLRNTRALRVGPPFTGMGDFSVAEDTLRDVLGITVEQIDRQALAADVEAVSESEVEEEVALDRKRFTVACDGEVHRRAVRVGLGLRKRLLAGRYNAFSMNFLAFDSSAGPVNTVPFLEASKAMGRGLGYAGEGDVLTASLVGALASGFAKTTFTEIFCPDWKGQTLFLSHMGEMNPEVAAEKPRLLEKPFPYTDALNPAVLTASPAPGPAVLVNLIPGPGDSFHIIVSPVEVLEDTSNPKMQELLRGWVRPAAGLESFLEAYSRVGGTHHSALVLGDRVEALTAFASFAGILWHEI